MSVNKQLLRSIGQDLPPLEGALKRLEFLSGGVDPRQPSVFKGPWQRDAVEWCVRRELDVDEADIEAGRDIRGGLLADEMGVGKTYEMLALLACNVCRTLILCPVNVKDQWVEASRLYLGVDPIVVDSSFRNDIPSQDTIVIIAPLSMFSADTMPAYLYQEDWVFSRIIVDEAHMMRNKGTQMFANIDRLQGDIKWVVTGTPIQNTIGDLYTLMEWAGLPHTTPLLDIKEKYMLRRTLLSVMPDMPNLYQHTQTLEMSPVEEAIYSFVENEFKKSNRVDTAFLLEAIMICRQVCVSPLIFLQNHAPADYSRKKVGTVFDRYNIDPTSLPAKLKALIAEAGKIPSTKMHWVVKDIKAAKHKKCIIFCMWIREMRILEHVLHINKASIGIWRRSKPARSINDSAILLPQITSVSYHGGMSADAKRSTLHKFQTQNDVKIIIMQINCSAVGLNIQAASRVYIMSPNWNPSIESQATGRAYRVGQTRAVTVVRVIMRNTVDERCLQVQQQKAKLIVDVMDDLILKERLRDASFSELTYIFRGAQKKRQACAAEEEAARKKQHLAAGAVTVVT